MLAWPLTSRYGNRGASVGRRHGKADPVGEKA
jgi:hypothetical protein